MRETLLTLIEETSTRLPPDVTQALKALPGQDPMLKIMRETLEISEKTGAPICQDTGFPYFYLYLPASKAGLLKTISLEIAEALKEATRRGFLRPNSVDCLTGSNPGDNSGMGLPFMDYEIVSDEEGPARCFLLLKGGGSENAGGQYALPFAPARASRDSEGIVKTVLYHVHQIQGQGCAPGILGLGIGGDRASSLKLAKKQLFHPLNQPNPDPRLHALEKEILSKANALEIGPMGLGGSPTLLGVKAAQTARHPASFFVSISYLCWVARRGSCLLPML